MSKVVKKVGLAIGKVVKGVKKVVSKAWDKIKSSKILKTIAIAAAVFVTGGAALGALGGFAASGISGIASGAMAGISSAWGGIVGAGSALVGGNVGLAGSALKAGITGAKISGAAAALGTTGAAITGAGGIAAYKAAVSAMPGLAGAATQAAGAATGGAATGGAATGGGYGVSTALVGPPPAPVTPGVNLGALGGQAGTTSQIFTNASLGQPALAEAAKMGMKEAVTAGVQEAGKQSLFSQMISSPYTAPALLNTAGNMISGYSQGRAQEEAEQDARRRYNSNIGARINPSIYGAMTGVTPTYRSRYS